MRSDFGERGQFEQIGGLQGGEVSGFPGSAIGNHLLAPAPAHAEQTSGAGLPAAIVLAVVAYAAARSGAALLNVKASVLDGVPLCLGAAAFLCFYGRVLFARAVRTSRVVESAFIIVAVGLSLASLSYLGAIMNLPLRDTQMIWIDRHLGFDWLATMRELDHWPALLRLLDGAYATFTSQLIATVLVLIIARRTRELDCFFVTFICASVIAEIASLVAPTLGPMSVLANDAAFAHLSTLGRATGAIVLTLRDGTLQSIDFDAINGIISFPSLHAAVAVLVPYALRWNKPLFWPIAVLDGLMLMSAVPSGNHYLIDVFGGLAVAVLAIVCGRRIHASLDRVMAPRLSKDRFATITRQQVQTPSGSPQGKA